MGTMRMATPDWRCAGVLLTVALLCITHGDAANDCCHVAGHCEWRGAHVFLDNYYCCPSGGGATSDSATQLAAGLETRPTLVFDTTLDTYTCRCIGPNAPTDQVCTHTPSPQGHVTMLPTTASAT